MINRRGFIHFKRLEYAAALSSFEEVRGICRTLLEQTTSGPKPVDLLDLLVLANYNIATVHIANKEFDKALEPFEKSLESRAALVADHPSVTKFQENLGRSYGEIADVQHRAHQD